MVAGHHFRPGRELPPGPRVDPVPGHAAILLVGSRPSTWAPGPAGHRAVPGRAVAGPGVLGGHVPVRLDAGCGPGPADRDQTGPARAGRAGRDGAGGLGDLVGQQTRTRPGSAVQPGLGPGRLRRHRRHRGDHRAGQLRGRRAGRRGDPAGGPGHGRDRGGAHRARPVRLRPAVLLDAGLRRAPGDRPGPRGQHVDGPDRQPGPPRRAVQPALPGRPDRVRARARRSGGWTRAGTPTPTGTRCAGPR